MSAASPGSHSEPHPRAAEGRAGATMIIVGGGALALSTAHEICLLPGHRVVVLWPADDEFAAAVEAVGARFVAGRPDSSDGLVAAGVEEAIAILALSPDDQLNLQSALRARDANPRIRIVLRQFNRTFATKIEQNLENCSVLSLAWHSAATYAAAALDPSCLRGLQFPDPDGPLSGFATRIADYDELVGRTVLQAERELGARIVAIDGNTDVLAADVVPAGARLIVYGALEQLLELGAASPARRRPASLSPVASHRVAPRALDTAPDRRLSRRIRRRRAGAVSVGHLAFSRVVRHQLADGGVFRADHDDHHRVRRYFAEPRQAVGRRLRDDADAGGHHPCRHLCCLRRLAADAGPVGADAGPAADPPARPHRRLWLRQHRQRGHRPVAHLRQVDRGDRPRARCCRWSNGRATAASIC